MWPGCKKPWPGSTYLHRARASEGAWPDITCHRADGGCACLPRPASAHCCCCPPPASPRRRRLHRRQPSRDHGIGGHGQGGAGSPGAHLHRSAQLQRVGRPAGGGRFGRRRPAQHPRRRGRSVGQSQPARGQRHGHDRRPAQPAVQRQERRTGAGGHVGRPHRAGRGDHQSYSGHVARRPGRGDQPDHQEERRCRDHRNPQGQCGLDRSRQCRRRPHLHERQADALGRRRPAQGQREAADRHHREDRRPRDRPDRYARPARGRRRALHVQQQPPGLRLPARSQDQAVGRGALQRSSTTTIPSPTPRRAASRSGPIPA